MTEENHTTENTASPGTSGGEREEHRTMDLHLPPRARQVFLWILLLLCFLAAFQFYFTVQEIIRAWINEPYIPFANAVFYLAVITGSIIVIRHWLTSR